jgi:hypothetical protein
MEGGLDGLGLGGLPEGEQHHHYVIPVTSGNREEATLDPPPPKKKLDAWNNIRKCIGGWLNGLRWVLCCLGV